MTAPTPCSQVTLTPLAGWSPRRRRAALRSRVCLRFLAQRTPATLLPQASTKAFSNMVAAMTIFALQIGRARQLSANEARVLAQGLKKVPELIEQYLANPGPIDEAVEMVLEAPSVMSLNCFNGPSPCQSEPCITGARSVVLPGDGAKSQRNVE